MTYQPAAHTFAVTPPPSMMADLLDQARRALDHDLDTARDVVARLSVLLNTPGNGEPEPANDRRLPAPRGAGLAPWRAKRLMAYIDDNLDQTISIEMLAGLVRLSCGHLSRAFRSTFGVSPHAMVMRRRVERAQGLMLRTRDSLSQIALSCGFADQAHFSRLFRQIVGATPNSWRRAHWIEA